MWRGDAGTSSTTYKGTDIGVSDAICDAFL